LVLADDSKLVLDTQAIVDLHKPFVAVGIPAFNEEQSIARIVLEAQKFADAVIVCDDGSTDMTAQIAQRLGADVVKHEGNCGYGAAIKSLFKHALDLGADVLVTLDGDGQHNASEIPNVIKPITEGSADIAIGSRFIDAKGSAEMPFYRKLGAKVITKLVNGSAKNGVSDSQSGFRAYNRQALECLCVSEVGMGASVQILLEASKHNLKISEVPSTCKYQNGDVSTSTENPITHGVGLIMSIVKLVVEDKPILFLGLPGITCLIMGTWFGVWMMNLYVSEGRIVTNIALASIGFLLLGCFMVSTAITLYAISRISQKVRKS
jgi:glycosyltransferase involved in cell wall biosynthesis